MWIGGYLASSASSPVISDFNIVFGESNEYVSGEKGDILSLSKYRDTLLLLVDSPLIKNPLSSCGEGIFGDVHATSGAWVWSCDGQCSGRIVIVWSSFAKFLTTLSVRMSKGRPSKTS